MRYLIFKLLKKSFLIIFFVVLSLTCLNIYIATLIKQKDMELINTFAKKTPHITIVFSDAFNEKDLNKILKSLKVTSYDIFKSAYLKNVKIGNIKTNIEFIGIKADHYPVAYSFKDMDSRLIRFQNIRPTTLELFDRFKNSEIVIFNKIMHHSMFNKISSTETVYKLKTDKKTYKITFSAIVDDLETKPVIYMSLDLFNSIINKGSYGIHINIPDQDRLYEYKDLLKRLFPHARIITWREKFQKQNSIIKTYAKFFNIIQVFITFLMIALSFLFLLREILNKQPQIYTLFMLGNDLSKYTVNIILFITVLAQMAAFALSKLLHMYLNSIVIAGMVIIPVLFSLITKIITSINYNISR